MQCVSVQFMYASPRRAWTRGLGAVLALSLLAAALPSSAAARQNPFILGVAVVAKGQPIAGGQVSAETLAGVPLTIRWGRDSAMRTTRANGAFALPRTGLPGRFVVVVRGGHALGSRTHATFRTVYSGRAHALATAQVSLGTTLQVVAYRHLRGRSDARLRTARARVIRALRFPGHLSLGFDDRVNPRYVSADRVRSLARRHGGVSNLVGYLNRTVVQRKVIARLGLGGTAPRRQMSRESQGAARVSEMIRQRVRNRADLDDSLLDLQDRRPPNESGEEIPDECSITMLTLSVESLAGCAIATTLVVGLNAWGDSPLAGDGPALREISQQLGELQTQVSNLQEAVQTGFLDLMAANSIQAYNTAAALPANTTVNIAQGINYLAQIALFSPGGSEATTPGAAQMVQAAVSELNAYMSNTEPGGFANPATATLLNQQTVATGVVGLGTLPAAWQAVRAQQQTGSLGATSSGDAALGQGTTLYTNEMSAAFTVASNYWYSWMAQLAILSANYWNLAYTQSPPDPPLTVEQAAANQLGGAACAPAPPCPGYIAYYLQQQQFVTPMTVPAGTVIDPTTNLIWGTAINTNLTGSAWPSPTASVTGLPVNPATGNALVPELLNQLNTGAVTPWAGVNSNVTAVASKIASGPPSFSLAWELPTVNFADGQGGAGGVVGGGCTIDTCYQIYDASTSPQLGMPGSGSGLLGGLIPPDNGPLNMSNLPGLTTPAAFPSTSATPSNAVGSWWVTDSTGWACPFPGQAPTLPPTCWPDGATSYYPSGVMTFVSNPVYQGGPKTGAGWVIPQESGGAPYGTQPQVAGATLVQSPVPGQQFQYPAVYPPSVLDNPTQLANLIQAYR